MRRKYVKQTKYDLLTVTACADACVVYMTVKTRWRKLTVRVSNRVWRGAQVNDLTGIVSSSLARQCPWNSSEKPMTTIPVYHTHTTQRDGVWFQLKQLVADLFFLRCCFQRNTSGRLRNEEIVERAWILLIFFSSLDSKREINTRWRWRHFRSKWKDYRGQRSAKFWSCDSRAIVHGITSIRHRRRHKLIS